MQKVFVVEGRQFRTANDYARAMRDKEIIDKLKKERNLNDRRELDRLYAELKSGKYKFHTLLGQDFLDEIEQMRKSAVQGKASAKSSIRRDGQPKRKTAATASYAGKQTARSGSNQVTKQSSEKKKYDSEMEAIVQEELKKREKRRKLIIRFCSLAAVLCLGCFGIMNYIDYRAEQLNESLREQKDKQTLSSQSRPQSTEKDDSGPLYTLDEKVSQSKEVLEEYINLFNQNKKLIGWVKIADTNIDYPVLQTSDNEYYLNHNIEHEYDRNGSIFMDKDCDVLEPSTNLILYGHHMKSGKMFGKLHLYEKESYYKEHPYIQFDTIYEKGLYEIMYVFRSRVYNEDEIVFKYYQFIDANSEQEFDSYMKEMASISFYDTGVTAEFGDRLLTLSTCDYEEKDGRFVVVAKKIAKE